MGKKFRPNLSVISVLQAKVVTVLCIKSQNGQKHFKTVYDHFDTLCIKGLKDGIKIKGFSWWLQWSLAGSSGTYSVSTQK